MRIHVLDNPRQAGTVAAAAIRERLRRTPDLLLCAASGDSTMPVYRALALTSSRAEVEQLRVIQLDEWAGLQLGSSASCREAIRHQLLEPLGLPESSFFGFRPDGDPDTEVKEMAKVLEREGPIDTCVLGLGRNGHLAFIEPASDLVPHSHVARLSDASRRHDMVSSVDAVPTLGMTLGIADLLNARYVQLIVAGKEKDAATESFLKGRITTALPATFLWLHPNVDCYLVPPR